MTKPTARTMRAVVVLLATLAGARMFAQAAPAGEASYPGFQLPSIGGSLSYALSVSESITSGYVNQGTGTSTNFSGDVAYLSGSERHPFSMVYTGGYLLGNSGVNSVYYQSLSLSQVAHAGRWTFIGSDSVSYLPETPTIGLSGVPGVGDLGGDPTQLGVGTGLGILTVNGARVSNTASVSAVRNLTASTSISLTGTDSIQRFLDSSAEGFDSNAESGSVGLQHRLDARSSVGGSYTYSRSSFSNSSYAFSSQLATVQYSRQLSRQLSMNVFAGPQWSTGNNALLEPTAVNLSVGFGLAYRGKMTTQALNYTRGTNTGFGVLQGARSDSINYTVSRNFARVWNTSATLGYSRSTSLFNNAITPAFSTDAEVAGAQVSRSLTRRLSAFASFTVAHQTTGGIPGTAIAFDGTYEVVSAGLTFSPGPIRLNRR